MYIIYCMPTFKIARLSMYDPLIVIYVSVFVVEACMIYSYLVISSYLCVSVWPLCMSEIIHNRICLKPARLTNVSPLFNLVQVTFYKRKSRLISFFSRISFSGCRFICIYL